MVAQIQREPVRPSEIELAISPQLDDVILKAMAKDPGQRYQTAAEFLTALGSVEESPVGRSQSVIQKSWTSTAVRVGAATFAIFSLAGVGSLRTGTPVHPTPPAIRSLPPVPISQSVDGNSVTSPTPPALKSERRVKTQRQPRRFAQPHTEVQAQVEAQPKPKPKPKPHRESQPPANAEAAAPESDRQVVGPPAPQASEAKKKRFWRKLNPLKWKKSN
jgi:serine/threonine protein kinase